MYTVIKCDPKGEEKIRYQGELHAQLSNGIVIQAYWTFPTKELGYTRFEPGDSFLEYYYTDRWFNIFDIAGAEGERKGWYCNIVEPAMIKGNCVRQADLYLDVWVTPDGEYLVLDEDEFTADTTLSATQRKGARQGLQELLHLITNKQDIFTAISR
ncbi:hypothetical protein EI42_01535 [Thermosporothrix hazakensis]|jgi:hypothetical protein|uniref:DUF402 domain-containing protein n=2 Tax=Thermosporothrix TaxID=768650 RepID=A0A326UBP2_THEHA|nr:DUF402 domain-containing protein [Thermosporothrix hazakensis]PZW32989.1 hypothetical protein EI42_01535 [Thermosporothrix hazakensis]BBH90971.1 hypothetical protein KTC_57220 [Thermosporothrix sp. COM3]GCE49021.1 hypothetical protein KTH_38900 [Thermosporothrix hazakensis]